MKVAAGHWSSSCRLRSQEVVGGPKKEGCVIDSAGGCCKLFRGGAAGRSWEPSGSSGRSVFMCLLYWVLLYWVFLVAGDLGVHYQLIWRIRLTYKYNSVGRQSRSGTSTHSPLSWGERVPKRWCISNVEQYQMDVV